MRTKDEMLKLILDVAINDDRIRAVTMEGSRVSKNATHDQYCDFDISYVVNDIRQFTKDNKWVEIFGEILIVQYPMDWYSHPYDYDGNDNFAYLIQFKDGNRIDLTLIDIRNIEQQQNYDEPRMVLLNKDNLKELKQVEDESVFYIQKPSGMEYYNTCNEFRWLSIYISKGLCRDELYYAKYAYDVLVMEMFIKMLNWKIGVDNGFNVTTGNHSKYLKRFLSSEEMEHFQSIFPDGTYEDIWNKLFVMYDYFAELARYVGEALGCSFDAKETEEVRSFLLERQKQSVN
jgi:aminoglycoside 6-adenylyltransferase